MKKTLSLLALLAVAGMASAPAQAATHYVSGMAGVSWMEKINAVNTYSGYSPEYDSNYDLGAGLNLLGAVGCDYGHTRLEAELGYQKHDFKSVDGIYWGAENMQGDVSVSSFLVNGYYDIELGSKVELYATAGVGVAHLSFNGVAPADYASDELYTWEETTTAWQIGAGLAVPISDNVKLDLRYRYFSTTDITVSSESFFYDAADLEPVHANVSSHSVLLGLRVDI